MLDAIKHNDAYLIIIAPQRFLGSPRKRMGRPVKRRLPAEIDKNLVHRETDIAEVIACHRDSLSEVP